MDRLKRFWDTAWGPITIGFVLVFGGWLLAVLQVLPNGDGNNHLIIAPTFLLQFLVVIMTTLGLMLGLVGAARIVVSNRNAAQNEKNRKSYPWEKQQGK